MMKNSLAIILAFSLAFPISAVAQDEFETQQRMTGPRKQLATIIMIGLGGAVLGLSTLSFYGRPQEHLNNIPMGFAVGVISGTIYSTYQMTTQPEMLTLNNPHKRDLSSPPQFVVSFDF